MADSEKDRKSPFTARVQLAGLQEGDTPPALAIYQIDTTGRAVKKLAAVSDGRIEVRPEWEKLAGIALGPDVEQPDTLRADHLLPYRLETIAPLWREHGITVARDLWERLRIVFVCVSGQVRKCRPWWWRHLEIIEASAGFRLTESIALRQISATASRALIPVSCLPLCDGIVEIYERTCCCRIVRIPDLLGHLREILEQIPIPLPHPPEPDPGPLDGVDLGRLVAARATQSTSRATRTSTAGIRRQAADLRARIATARPDPLTAPSERLYDDYVALSGMSLAQGEAYVRERPYLLDIICSCRLRKVGEVPLQPGGRFDFCYRTSPTLYPWCYRSFAYRVRQRINNAWVTVYDGIASHDWFSGGTPADLRTWDWRALVCGSGPGDPPPSDGGLPFAMLEYVGSSSTKHFCFPAQSGVSHLGALAANSGTYTTSYGPDCAWGASLGLRLWVHPGMQPIATYYRLSVVPVDDTGAPSGSASVLDAPVTWDRFILVAGDWVTTHELLSADPSTVGGQHGLNKIPYWSGGNYWLDGQYHQIWNTALFAEGRYLLLLELFDAAGARIKPSSAPAADPGAARPFEFRRWRFNDTTATDNVPFADAAHAFWIDNTPVSGDIVDIRKNGTPSSDECQFLSGPSTTDVAVGFRAFHAHGVSKPADSFMLSYSLTWTRGLNGPGGSFANGTANVGEISPPVPVSNTLTSGFLLGPFPPGFPDAHQRCTFAIQLHVAAKHFNGSSRLSGYDYHETASFALSIE